MTVIKQKHLSMYPLKCILLLCCGLCLPLLSFAQKNWELKKNEDGIKVFWRASADSDVKELKIKTEIEASLNTVVAVMSDTESYTDWVYAVTEARTLREIARHESVYYNVIDFPWPMDDRDIILHTRTTQDPVTKVVVSRSSAAPSEMPEDDSMVRVRHAEITWIITPLSPGRVSVDYRLITDPGGSIPAFLINIASDYGPFKTMQAFKERVKLPQYRAANVEGIENMQLADN